MGSAVFHDAYQVSGVGYFEQNVRVNYSESYDAVSNRSTVTVTSVEIASSRSMGECPVFGSVQINGTTVLTLSGGSANTANISGSAASYGTVTGSGGSAVLVAHDELGAAVMTLSLTGGQNGVFGARYNSKMFGVRTTASQSAALATHPRASAIVSCPSAAATLGVLTLSVRRNSSAFYHRASFSADGTLLYTSEAFASSLSFTIPRSWFASFPSAASLAVTVSVQTYSDSSCATAVGSPAASAITVTADADMRPAPSAGWAVLTAYNSGAVAGMTGYIRGYSRAEAVFDRTKIDMSAAVGASIASCSVACQGETVGASPYRTGVLASTAVGVVCTVTDTRGRTASESFSLSVADYAPPVLTEQEIFRCDASLAADGDGMYFSVKTALSFSPLGGQNTCSLHAAYAVAGGSYGTESVLSAGTASRLGPVSPDLSCTVRITAEDALGNRAEYYEKIPTRRWAMKFRPNGRGVAFGKAAETDDLFEIAEDWAVKSRGIVDLIYPVGSVYLSVGGTSPAVLFGGTWEQIKDRFLLSAGDVYAAGSTGGEATHTLTNGELPKLSGSIGFRLAGGSYSPIHTKAGSIVSLDSPSAAAYTTLTLTGSAATSYHRATISFGDDKAHNNMPPYLAVYIWKRTA